MIHRKLWSVCKRLSNAERLDALRKVLLSLDAMSVSQISEKLHLQEAATSQYLAQLEFDCGLIAPERKGRYVCYRPEADPEDPRCEKLLQALQDFFRQEAQTLRLPLAYPQSAPAFARGLPALSNEGRIRICLHLRHGGNPSIALLYKLINQCESGIRRHLDIIAKAGLGEWRNTGYFWKEPTDPILRLFLDLLEEEYCPRKLLQ